jgi:rod shape-determining protein MreD
MYVIFTLLVLVGSLVLQTSFFPIIAPKMVIPDLILVIVVYLGLTRGSDTGCTAGFFFGIIEDLCTKRIYLGSNALSKTLVGFFCGLSGKRLYTQSLFSQILCVIVGTVVDILLLLSINGFVANWKQIIFYETLYNLICCPFIVFIFRQGEKRLRVQTPPSRF